MITSFTISIYNSGTHERIYQYDYHWDEKAKCYRTEGKINSTKVRTLSRVPSRVIVGEYSYWRLTNVKYSGRNTEI